MSVFDMVKEVEDKKFFQVLKAEIDEIESEYKVKQPEAFVLWAIFNIFGLDESDALNAGDIGGSGDKAVDALWIDENESKAYIIQGKFKSRSSSIVNRETIADFMAVPDRLQSVEIMTSKGANRTLKERAREYREAVDLQYDTELILLTTGKVAPNALEEIKVYNEVTYDDRKLSVYDFEYLKREYEERLTQTSQLSVNANLDLLDSAYFEFHINSQRSIVFTVSGDQLASLAAKYGLALFEQNVRFELSRKKVNKGILETLSDPAERQFFWYYNNGISMICEDFEIDTSGSRVKVKGLQIVNGCQTTMTLKRALDEVSIIKPDVKILARLTIPQDETLAEKIAEYNNSQTEVIPRDFRANDAIQIRLQKELKRKGFLYIRKRGEKESWTRVERRDKMLIDMEKMAQILFSFYHDKPSEAKAEKKKLFDKNHPFYKNIFHSNISAEDLILPFLIRDHISKKQTELRRKKNALRKENINSEDIRWIEYHENEFILHSDLHILNAVKHLMLIKYKNLDTAILMKIKKSPKVTEIIESLVEKAIRATSRLVESEKDRPEFTYAKYFKSDQASLRIGKIVREINKDAKQLYGQKSLVEDIPWP